jgi:hypothetical protein
MVPEPPAAVVAAPAANRVTMMVLLFWLSLRGKRGVTWDLVATDPKEVEGSGACGKIVLLLLEMEDDLAMAKVLDKLANLVAAKIADEASSGTSVEGQAWSPTWGDAM